MHIAHLTATFLPYQGGTGNVVYHNARVAVTSGYQVTVFTPRSKNTLVHESFEGFRVHRLWPWGRIGNAAFLPSLLWELRGVDLIHLHYPFFGAEAAVVVAQLTDTPLVITYHQDVHLCGIADALARFLRHTVGRWMLRSAVRVCFTSADYGTASYARPLLKGREAHIGVLPNGVDINHFFPDPPSGVVRGQLRLAPQDRIVLLVAKLDQAHYFKGVEVALNALPRLPSCIKLVVVGDGPLRSQYEATARAKGVDDQVRFVGAVGADVLPDLYRSADVTILPSVTMGEAFGLVLVESLACGTPVIASNLPGVRTVVNVGIDGYLIAPGDPLALARAIERLLTDENQRRMMGEQGYRKVASRYQWDTIGCDLLTLYDTLVHKRPKRVSARGKS